MSSNNTQKYDFLNKTNSQIFKPNNIPCNADLTLNVIQENNKINNDFTSIINYLANYYKCTYYYDLEDYAKSLNLTIPLNINTINNLNYKIKDIVLRFIESRSDLKLYILHNSLEIGYDIYYNLQTKDRNIAFGILLQIESSINPNFIKSNYDSILNNYLNEENIYNFYFYYVKKQIKQNVKYIDQYTIENYNCVREISQVIFNDLTLEVFSLSRFDRFLSEQFNETLYNHIIYKRFLYSKIKNIDHIRFILFSCSILFTLGNTYCQDIDLLAYSEEQKSEYFNDVVKEYFDDKTTLPLIDFHMKGHGEWTNTGTKTYLNKWFIVEWPNLYGSKNLEETIFNPQFHYYFLGMKFIHYKADIIRRIKRNRSTAYTDLIMLDFFNGLKIKPFKLERTYWENQKENTYSNNDLEYILQKIIKNILRWHGILISAQRVYDYIIWPDDFKLLDHKLKIIDSIIKNWIIKNNIKVLDIPENNNKINLIIQPYK